jgi:hypothetical protein
MKILFLAANPTATGRLALDEEARAVTQKIRQADNREALEFITELAVRPDDLLQYLNQYKPQVVHFSGHGNAGGEIILVGDSREAKRVSTAALQALFETMRDNIRLVVLNSCYSKEQAAAISSQIDFVVGMNSSIEDSAAVVFSAAFYRALGYGRTVSEAFAQARTALLLEGLAAQGDVPELIVRVGADQNLCLAPSPNASGSFVVWKKVLDRPAFRTSCVEELFLHELREAIDDTQAAFNTGRLYSRSGNLLADLPLRWSPQEAGVIRKIVDGLTRLKASVARFDADFREANPRYRHHENFFAMWSSLKTRSSGQNDHRREALLRQMDEIDQLRNELISLFNSMAGPSDDPLPLLELSSVVARQRFPWILE